MVVGMIGKLRQLETLICPDAILSEAAFLQTRNLDSLRGLAVTVDHAGPSVDCPSQTYVALSAVLKRLKSLSALSVQGMLVCYHNLSSLGSLSAGLAAVSSTVQHLSLGLIDAHGARLFEQDGQASVEALDLLFRETTACVRLIMLRLHNFHVPAAFITAGAIDLSYLRVLDLLGCSFHAAFWSDTVSHLTLRQLSSVNYALLSPNLLEQIAKQPEPQSLDFSDPVDQPWTPPDLYATSLPPVDLLVRKSPPSLTQVSVPISMHCHGPDVLTDLLPWFRSLKRISIAIDFNDHVSRPTNFSEKAKHTQVFTEAFLLRGLREMLVVEELHIDVTSADRPKIEELVGDVPDLGEAEAREWALDIWRKEIDLAVADGMLRNDVMVRLEGWGLPWLDLHVIAEAVWVSCHDS